MAPKKTTPTPPATKPGSNDVPHVDLSLPPPLLEPRPMLSGTHTFEPSPPTIDTPPLARTADLDSVQIEDVNPRLEQPALRITGNALSDYVLPSYASGFLPAPDADGLRIRSGRQYADLDTGATVAIAWDTQWQSYRIKRLQERMPSGPGLRLNADRATWSLHLTQLGLAFMPPLRRPLQEHTTEVTDSPKRPRLEQPGTEVEPINPLHYAWDETASNHHGYVILHRKNGLDDAVGPELLHAFKNDHGLLFRVEPSATRFDEPAQLLAEWTDHNLWNFYGIHGPAITRFRVEAQLTGQKPQWARLRKERMNHKDLYEELRRWIYPTMDRGEFIKTLQTHDYTAQQLAEKLEKANSHWQASAIRANALRDGVPAEIGLTGNQPSNLPAFGDLAHYVWDAHSSNFQGYVELHRKPDLDDSHGPLVQLGFRDGGQIFKAGATGYSSDAPALFLPFWRDYDIWSLYRIDGQNLRRFRQEVASSGKPPAWAKSRAFSSTREQLSEHLRLWTSPHATPLSASEFNARLRPFNLSVEHLARLCDELTVIGQFPDRLNNELPRWADDHRRSMLDETHAGRFDAFVPEMRAEIVRLRNQGHGVSALHAHLSVEFFQGLLRQCDFQRNRHHCLFRTDFPALFRGDDRSPFEFARDGALFPRATLPEGTTSWTAVSATFGLKQAMEHARQISLEALAYDSQMHRYPGKPQSSRSGPLTDEELHLTNDYVPKRLAQCFGFCYLLDTRQVEVVPGRDNQVYNQEIISSPPPGSKTWCPRGELEGHISMSPRGLSATRIWLVNSSMTRAANVADIYAQALSRPGSSSQTAADAIEERTWAGNQNRHEYDELIDEVAVAGLPVIEFTPAENIFSNDIVFPQPQKPPVA